jgi:hypothetical protein
VNRSGSTRNCARTESFPQAHVDSEASTFHFGKQPMNKSTVRQVCSSRRLSRQDLRQNRETAAKTASSTACGSMLAIRRADDSAKPSNNYTASQQSRCDAHHICCGETVAASPRCNTGRIELHGLTGRVLRIVPGIVCRRCLRALPTSAVPAVGLPRAGAAFLSVIIRHCFCRRTAWPESARYSPPAPGTPAPPFGLDFFCVGPPNRAARPRTA